MNKTWMDAIERWQTLPMRTRRMLFVAGLVLILGGMDTYMTEPLRQQARVQREDAARMLNTMSGLQKQMEALRSGGQRNPLAMQTQALAQDVMAQEKRLSEVNRKMVGPDEVLFVVKSLLAQHPNVRVRQLKSLPAVDFFEKHKSTGISQTPANHAAKPASGLFQHTIQLKIEGRYDAIMGYVADLKHLDAMLGWEHAEMKAHYPLTELSLDIYTLSRQPVWLGL